MIRPLLPGFSPRRRVMLGGVLAIFVLLGLFAGYWKLPALLWFWGGTWWRAEEWREATPPHRRLWLPDYRVTIDAKPMPGINHNASSLTYDDRSRTLYLTLNRPPTVVELSAEGDVLRRMPVVGINDLEGITHIQGDHFALIDEDAHRIIEVRIAPDAKVIDVAGSPQMSLDFSKKRNLGFEGVSWNASKNQLFVGKEKSPLRIYSIEGFLASSALTVAPLALHVREWRPQVEPAAFMRDLSSLSLHDPSGHVLVLSDESSLLAEYAHDGRLVSLMPLWRGWHGLSRTIPQAEGVTVSPDGTIFVVSEPNLFYRFEKTPRQ